VVKVDFLVAHIYLNQRTRLKLFGSLWAGSLSHVNIVVLVFPCPWREDAPRGPSWKGRSGSGKWDQSHDLR